MDSFILIDEGKQYTVGTSYFMWDILLHEVWRNKSPIDTD